ncbi:MAG: hypothetical protein OHK0019_27290 [Saprospiraceae bacterium]
MNTRTEQLIEAWFANTLSQNEASELQQLLATDPEVAAEFAWQQSLAHAVRTGKLGNDSIHNHLHKVERRFRSRRLTFRILAVAAAVTALVVAIWFLNRPAPAPDGIPGASKTDTLETKPQPVVTTPQDSDKLQKEALEKEKKAAEKELQRQKAEQQRLRKLRDSLNIEVVANFQHFMNDSELNAAGGVEEGKKLAKNAFVLYDDKKYAQAATAFKSVLNNDPTNIQYQFFYAVSLLGAQQYESAARNFRVLTKQENDYQTPSKFYLGLALTGAGQYKEARQAFQDYLATPNNRLQFKSQASKMLSKLPVE